MVVLVAPPVVTACPPPAITALVTCAGTGLRRRGAARGLWRTDAAPGSRLQEAASKVTSRRHRAGRCDRARRQTSPSWRHLATNSPPPPQQLFTKRDTFLNLAKLVYIIAQSQYSNFIKRQKSMVYVWSKQDTLKTFLFQYYLKKFLTKSVFTTGNWQLLPHPTLQGHHTFE